MWQPLVIALGLLTRFPVRFPASVEPSEVGRSVLWYPAVGLLAGLLVAGVGRLGDAAPEAVGAALALLTWCVATGGLHLDGLADSADAFVGGHGEPARTLAIMKDAAAGPMGVVAVCLVLIVKFAALAALIAAENWVPIVLAPVLGRAAVIALLLGTPYVRPGGMGEALAAHLPRGPAGFVLATALAAAVLSAGLGVLIGAGLAFLLLRTMMKRAIGGTTGDTIGALVETTEAAALVAATL